MKRLYWLTAAIVVASAVASGCKTAGTAAPNLTPSPVAYHQKLGWILQLEDRRILREIPPPPPPAPTTRKGRQQATQVPAETLPDLGVLIGDEDSRIRRRAALAVGRVGLPAGIDILVPLLHDGEPEVRQMAAFAMGLIGDPRAVTSLRAALADPSPIVQGRAAEALGLVGDKGSAPQIAAMVATVARSGAVSKVAPDQLSTDDPAVDAFRLGVFALTRLKAFNELAGAVLDQQGQPVATWWPVAYALGRTPDARALPALRRLVSAGVYSRMYALRGLGALKDRDAVPLLLPFVGQWRTDLVSAIAATRAAGAIGDQRAVQSILALLQSRETPGNLRLEAVGALAALRAAATVPVLLDLVGDPWPSMRVAALDALRQIDQQQLMVVLSGLEPDSDWSVRAAVASMLGSLPADVAIPRLNEAVADQDARVVAAAVPAVAKLAGPQTGPMLIDFLKREDPVVRSAAASQIGELKLPGAEQALVDAYKRAVSDKLYTARAAALEALTKYGAAAAMPTLKEALKDKDWAVRVRAASLLKTIDQTADTADAIRPAPTRQGVDYQSTSLVAPEYSTHAYIDTTRGTIEIELAVLDAPLTSQNFVTLARSGFFDNVGIHRVVPNFVMQDGDPRGDGEGGPGYTIRDELNEVSYLRGTVGMALDWVDTGGSQFFITTTPQPHLDAKYTVFGRVVSGLDVLDKLQQWDVIKEIRVWDGKSWK